MRRLVLISALLCFLVTMGVSRSDPQGIRRSRGTASNNTLELRLDNLASKISDKMTENQKHTIAVVEFSDLKGNVTNFGRFLSEELITRLYETKKFKVIERQQLNKIIAEQKLSLTGIVDPTSAQKLGRVLGVDSIIFGSISDLVKTLKINARLIGTETGEVFAAASIEIIKDQAVTSLMRDGVSPGAASPEGPAPSPRPAPKPQGSMRIESHFFTFDLQKCRLSGTSVVCELIVTNNERDRPLSLGWSTRMFDDFGNEKAAEVARMANDSGNYGQIVRATLISGVATKAWIVFEGVAPQASKMTVFRIEFHLDEGRSFYIEYRNVPLRE